MVDQSEAEAWVAQSGIDGSIVLYGNDTDVYLLTTRARGGIVNFRRDPPEGMKLRLTFSSQGTVRVKGTLPKKTTFVLGDGRKGPDRVCVGSLDAPMFTGGGLVEVRGAVIDAQFKGDGIGKVEIPASGSLISASGEPAVLTNEGFVSGAPESALKPGRLESGTGQYENIDVSRLTVADLQAIRAAERFVPHMPRSRRTALRYAESMTMGRQDPNSNATSSERVHFWTQLAALVGAQGGAGETATTVKEVATVLHRKALPLRSPQRWLLEISRIFGYGTRLRRPLVVWALATLAGWGLLAYWSGLKDFPQELAWWELPKDLLLSPLNFFRSTPIPTEEWVAGLGAKFRLVLQIVRGVSSTAIAFFAVAVRRYTAPIRRS